MADRRGLRTATTAMALLAFAGSLAHPGQGLAIVGATVIDGSGRDALADAVVVVDGERLGDVGPRSHVALPKGIPYLDGRGHFVVPARLAEPALRAALRQRLREGARFEEAAADALRYEGGTTGVPTLERGRPADLLVLDKDPRKSLEHLGSVVRKFSRGRELPR